MPRQDGILHTSIAGQRSVWVGRKKKYDPDRTTNSFAEFCRRARRSTKDVIPGDNQLHLARHHRGFNPKEAS